MMAQFPAWHWLGRFCVASREQRFSETVGEIRRLIDEALHDFPSDSQSEEDAEKNRRHTEPPAIALQAQLLNTFRRDLGLSYSETESIPLKRLVQLYRELIYSATGGKGLSLMTRAEAAIWREHLGRKNGAT